MTEKITSFDIKHALMCYFRFTRQWLCASECMNNDVMALTNKDIIEVEVKVSKYDLWKGEAKKDKHRIYNNEAISYYRSQMPNRFYICVPISLEEEARLWVEQTNKKYGIIRYNSEFASSLAISIAKTASTIIKSEGINETLERAIMMRVCAENIGLMKQRLRKEAS